MKYFQCSKCKKLKETGDAPDISDIVCDSRRMRELTKIQYDHEKIQREHVENGGPAPADTDLMNNIRLV